MAKVKVASNRVEGVSLIQDKICDVIYKRGEKLIPQLISLFSGLSVRRLSSIQDINGLFDTLNRLNLGSIHNLWAFVQIADFLQDQELANLIADVGQLDIPEGDLCCIGRNLYAYRRTHRPPAAPSTGKTLEESPPARPAPTTTRETNCNQSNLFPVFDLLSRELGRQWRDLGRSLGFLEADLDQFEESHSKDLKGRVHAMLQEFCKEYVNEQEMLDDICQALDKCRRLDLRKRIQQKAR